MEFLAITSYFNPFGGRLRRRNYDAFRRHLGVPLLTVEWSPDGRFELGEGDADFLVRASGGDVLWQKERLLNIGLSEARALRPGIVALLDCDIVFTDPGWHGKVAAALASRSFVQCYEQVDYLADLDPIPDRIAVLASSPVEHTGRSIASRLCCGEGLFKGGRNEPGIWPAGQVPLSGNPGMAVAMRGEELLAHGLYEGNVVGGGDLVAVAAFADRLGELFENREYSPAHQEHIRSWAAGVRAADPGIGFAPNRLLHLWHGSLADRRYSQRMAILNAFGYDPVRDVVPAPGEPLRLRGHADALKRSIAEYMAARRDA